MTDINEQIGKDINSLVNQYEVALTLEYKAITRAEARRVALLSQAYAGGTIDGKNAEQRAVQIDALLLADTTLQTFEQEAARAKIQRQVTEARIDLVRAMLHGRV